MNRNSTIRAGFTLIELMAVVLILAILAGVALPRFFDYQVRAREAACKGTLGGVRAGVANYYANEAITNGTAVYPSIAQLTDVGEVMQEAIPDNPYTGGDFDPDVVTAAVLGDVALRALKGGGTGGGWAYFPGDATNAAVFYANTDSVGEHTF
jgi:MSHA pilin protein MshA